MRHNNTINIPERIKQFHVPANQLTSGNLRIGTPDDVEALPRALHLAVVTGFADSMQVVFASAAPFAIGGFLVVLFLREARLDTREVAPADVADAALDVNELADSARP